jgi:hypothetical protein
MPSYDSVDIKFSNFVVASKFFKGVSILLLSRPTVASQLLCRKSHHSAFIFFKHSFIIYLFIYSQNFDFKGYCTSVFLNQCFTLFSNQIHYCPFNESFYTVKIAVISFSLLFCYIIIKFFTLHIFHVS